MKKIINPWEGLDGYMCFGCAPSNPMGLHMEFYEDGDDIVAYWEPEAHYLEAPSGVSGVVEYVAWWNPDNIDGRIGRLGSA